MKELFIVVVKDSYTTDMKVMTTESEVIEAVNGLTPGYRADRIFRVTESGIVAANMEIVFEKGRLRLERVVEAAKEAIMPTKPTKPATPPPRL
jgi:hypothetical protein